MAECETTSEYQGNREFTRVPVDLRVRVRSDELEFETERVRDISLNGILLESEWEHEMEAGAGVEATIMIGGGVGEDGFRVEVSGEAARVSDGLLAISFRCVRDAEGIEHLRRLVRYNAADPEQVESEFDAHVGIKPSRG